MNIYDHIPQLTEHVLFKGIDSGIISKYICEDNISLKKYMPGEVILSKENAEGIQCKKTRFFDNYAPDICGHGCTWFDFL